MLGFAFEKEIVPMEQDFPEDTPTLLMKLLMLMLENERLNKMVQNSQGQYDEISFAIHNEAQYSSITSQGRLSHEKEQEYKLELELKQIKIDNLSNTVRQLQEKSLKNQISLQEATHKLTLLEISSKQDHNETKGQLAHYKAKYEQQIANSKKSMKLEQQLKLIKLQLESKSKQYISIIQSFKMEMNVKMRESDTYISELEGKNKEHTSTLQSLRFALTAKQEEIFQLKSALRDSPKQEQLNRWMNKARESDEKQMQACGKISQISQELCTARQKYRKLEHEHKELQKVKNELENNYAVNKSNQENMTVYFQRLTSYERSMKDMEQQIHRLQEQNERLSKESQERVKRVEQERDNAINQWQAIIDEMTKQKQILTTMQAEMDQYYRQNVQQRQSSTQKSQYQPLTYNKPESRVESFAIMQNSKVTEKSNRSASLKQKRTEYRSYLDMDSKIQSYESTSRLEPPIGRVASQQQLIYHSDARTRYPSRLNSQQSQNCSSRDLGCGECMSRVQDQDQDMSTRQNSQTRNVESRARYQRAEDYSLRMGRGESSNRLPSEIADEKKLLMQKLNVLNSSNETSLRATDRSISYLYTKNYRQTGNSGQLLMQNAANSKLANNKLRISKSKQLEDKENLNNMIMMRYAHLVTK